MNYLNLIFRIIYLLTFQFAYSQQKFDWEKYNGLPFKEDSVKTFPHWDDERNIIYPIKNSNADLEIRLYYLLHNGNGAILTMRCFGDSVLFEEILGTYIPEPLEKVNTSIYFKYEKGHYWQINKKKVTINPRDVLDDLIKNELFILGDVNTGKEILKKKNRKDISIDSGFAFQVKPNGFFELKLKTRYRSFGVYSIIYFDEKGNRDFLWLGEELLKLFSSIIIKSKSEKYEYAY